MSRTRQSHIHFEIGVREFANVLVSCSTQVYVFLYVVDGVLSGTEGQNRCEIDLAVVLARICSNNMVVIHICVHRHTTELCACG
jgi:sulfur relay (sulfurtransferase) complex TusBCD TusD component (DsrE family)